MRGNVVQRVLQNGAWYSRVLVIQGNQGIPCVERHVKWNQRITDLDLAKRIFPSEFRFCESRETFETSPSIAFALQALVKNLQSWERAFHQFGNGRGTFDVKDRKCSL